MFLLKAKKIVVQSNKHRYISQILNENYKNSYETFQA